MDGDARVVLGLVRPTVWQVRLRAGDGRLLHEGEVRNTVLSPGRLAAARQLLGIATPAMPYRWLEIGASSRPTNAGTDTGCVAPVKRTDGRNYRAQGTWSDAGGLLSFFVTIPGSEVQANIREWAVFNSEEQGVSPALYRIVYPSILALTSGNALEIAATYLP